MNNQIDYLKKQVSILVNLYNTGKYDDVVQKGMVLIKKFPDQEIFINATALSLSSLNKNEEALKILKSGILKHPNNIFILNNLGLINTRLNNYKIAREYLNKALSINKDYIDSLVNLGNLDLTEMNMDSSKNNYEKALKLSKSKQSDEIIYTALGHYHQQAGDFELALKNLYKVNEINPQNTTADKSISLITKYKDKDNNHLKSMVKKLNLNLSKDQKQSLYFSLGKAFEDIKLYKESFDFLSSANRIANNRYKYNLNDDKKLFQQLHELFISNKNQIKSDIKTKIIFIVGMPRSGTTLVEQIISSHPEVNGAGELNYVAQYGGNLAINLKSKNTVLISEFRDKYLTELSKLSNGKSIITDKMPQNFRFIPLICAALPEAKIIHVQRNAAATCWSNYKSYFPSDSLGYCYDLEDIVTYFGLYKDYERALGAMSRLRKHFPDARIVARSDGDHDPRYHELTEKFDIDYREEERLYPIENGGAMVARMLA